MSQGQGIPPGLFPEGLMTHTEMHGHQLAVPAPCSLCCWHGCEMGRSPAQPTQPPVGVPTCPLLVTTERYHRYLILNRASVAPSAGRSPAGRGGAVGVIDRRITTIHQHPSTRHRVCMSRWGQPPDSASRASDPVQRTSSDRRGVGPPGQDIGLKGHATNWRVRGQAGNDDLEGPRHCAQGASALSLTGSDRPARVSTCRHS